MCDFAVDMDISDKNYSRNLTINKDEDDEHGIPFTTRDLMTLWYHSDNDVVELLLILCYSGWRINEVRKLHIDLENGYFEGEIKTKAEKIGSSPFIPQSIRWYSTGTTYMALFYHNLPQLSGRTCIRF